MTLSGWRQGPPRAALCLGWRVPAFRLNCPQAR